MLLDMNSKWSYLTQYRRENNIRLKNISKLGLSKQSPTGLVPPLGKRTEPYGTLCKQSTEYGYDLLDKVMQYTNIAGSDKNS